MELLNSELGRVKPRVDVLKDLMRRTFPEVYIGNEPSTLLEQCL